MIVAPIRARKNRNIKIRAKQEFFSGNLSFRVALDRSEKSSERNTDLAVTVKHNLFSIDAAIFNLRSA
jgi:hypothetical protein